MALRYNSQEKLRYLLTTGTVRCFSAYNGGLAASSGARKEQMDQVQQHSHYCNSARSEGTPVSHSKHIRSYYLEHKLWLFLYLCRGKGKGHPISHDWQREEYNTHSWPRPLYPQERALVPIYKRLGGLRSPCGWIWWISFPHRDSKAGPSSP